MDGYILKLITENNKPIGFKCIKEDASTSTSEVTTTESSVTSETSETSATSTSESVTSSESGDACKYCEAGKCLK